MSTLFSDTTPEAEAVMFDLLDKMSSVRRFKIVTQLNARMKTMMMAGLRQNYPHANEAELRRRMADLLIGEELAEKVYGHAT